MMLSRVAGSMYWLGRYLERAENVCRLMIVTSEDSAEFEGLDDQRAAAEWDQLDQAIPGWTPPPVSTSTESRAIQCIESLLLDLDSPVSVRATLGNARENARSVREAITREIFENLNEAHQGLQRRRRFRDRVVAVEAITETHRSILTTLGAIEHTLSRDQGWTFMKLGEAMARTLRTLLVLRAKLPALRSAAGADLPIYYARWRSLLRSVASLENYRRSHGSLVHPDEVVAFLLFDPEAPRSVRCGVNRIQRYIEILPGSSQSQPARIAGKIVARIEYDDEKILSAEDLTPFCDEMIERIRSIYDAVEHQYLTR